jgi:hypothetical protein
LSLTARGVVGSLFFECKQQHLFAQQPISQRAPSPGLATGQLIAGNRKVEAKNAMATQMPKAILFIRENNNIESGM